MRKRLNRPLTLAEKVCCPRLVRASALALRGLWTQHAGETWNLPAACESLLPTCCQPSLQGAHSLHLQLI